MKFDLTVDRTGKRPQKRACVRELMRRYRKQGKLIYGLGHPGAYCAIGQFAPEAAKYGNKAKSCLDTFDCIRVTYALFGGSPGNGTWEWLWEINDHLASLKYGLDDLEAAYEAYLKNPKRFNVWDWADKHPPQ